MSQLPAVLPRLTTSTKINQFNDKYKTYLRRKYKWKSVKDEDAVREAFIKHLFGTSPTAGVNASAQMQKFKVKEINEFLELTEELRLIPHLKKAIDKLGDTLDFNALTQYVTFLTKLQDRRIYKWFNPIRKLGNRLKGKIENLAKTIEQKQNDSKGKNPKAILRNLLFTSLPYFVGVSSYIGWRTVMGSVPCTLGVFPLKHVREIEVARSGKILKFRASGSVFLANQEGGKDAIRIEGILYKTEIAFLLILWFLFLYGRGQVKGIPLTGITGTIDTVRLFADILVTNPSLQKPSYEYHRTFPFVSRHFIIPNCYIETITFEDKLPFRDIIQYSVLLRTYEKPSHFDIATKDTALNSLKGLAAIGMGKTKTDTITSQLVEFGINTAWRLHNASGFFLNEQEWKLGSAISERDFINDEEEDEYDDRIKAREKELDRKLIPKEKNEIKQEITGAVFDTYYNVDPTSIASVIFLSLMGVA